MHSNGIQVILPRYFVKMNFFLCGFGYNVLTVCCLVIKFFNTVFGYSRFRSDHSKMISAYLHGNSYPDVVLPV